MLKARFAVVFLLLVACSDDPTGPGGGPGDWVQIATGEAHACALTAGGGVYCWGDTGSGQAGQPVGPVTGPSAVDSDMTFVSVAAGGDTSCALAEDGGLYCWGNNALGQLGDGTGLNSFTPVQVSGGHRWQSVSVGTYHVCGIASDDRLHCWGGDRWDAALGYPALADCTAPVFEPTWPCQDSPQPDFSPGTFDWVEAGLYQTCAGSAGGGVCWGVNGLGELGATTSQLCAGNDPQHPSDRACSRVPIAPDGPPFDRIAPGSTHGCGLTGADVYCWGGLSLNFGQVGDGSLDGAAAAVAVASGGPWRAVSTAHGAHIRAFSCGIEEGGAARCWGANRFGQLGSSGAPDCGVSSVPCWDVPTPVEGGYTFDQLALGVEFVCGLTTGRDIVCWGQGGEGQLGDGMLDARATPMPIVF